MAVLRLDRHDVGVYENSSIPRFIQKIDPREVQVQAEEDVYIGFRDVVKGPGYLDIRGGRDIDEVESLRNRIRGHAKPP